MKRFLFGVFNIETKRPVGRIFASCHSKAAALLAKVRSDHGELSIVCYNNLGLRDRRKRIIRNSKFLAEEKRKVAGGKNG
jgi:hypothetical protein